MGNAPAKSHKTSQFLLNVPHSTISDVHVDKIKIADSIGFNWIQTLFELNTFTCINKITKQKILGQ